MERSEYHKYLASREWAVLREAVRQRAKGRCERCKAMPMHSVHHLTYERIGSEDLKDLQGVCEACHKYLSAKSRLDPVMVVRVFSQATRLIDQAIGKLSRAEDLIMESFQSERDQELVGGYIEKLDQVRMWLVDNRDPLFAAPKYREEDGEG